MTLPDKVEAVKKVSEVLSKDQTVNPAEGLERVAPNKEHFQSLLNAQPAQPTFQRVDGVPVEASHHLEKPVFADENVSAQKSGTATDQENKKRRQSDEVESVSGSGSKKKSVPSSLIEEVKKLNAQTSTLSRLSPADLQDQAKGIITQIDKVKTQLSQTQSEIKPSYQTLLRNRLGHIDDNLKIALSKAGVEVPPAKGVQPTGKVKPLERFIDSLTHSQYELENLESTISQLNLSGAGQLTPANMLALQIKMSHVQQQVELFTSLLNKALESTKTIMNVQV